MWPYFCAAWRGQASPAWPCRSMGAGLRSEISADSAPGFAIGREKRMNFAQPDFRARLVISFGLLLLLIVGLTAFAVSNMGGFNSGAAQFVLLFGFVSLGVGAGLGWWLNRSMAAALQQAIGIAKRMAAGDLSEPFDADARGAIGELQLALQETSARMFRIVADVRAGTMAIASTSGLIAADNAALSSRTESQASALEETA